MRSFRFSFWRRLAAVCGVILVLTQPVLALELGWGGGEGADWNVAENWLGIIFTQNSTTNKIVIPIPDFPDFPEPEFIHRVPQDGDRAIITSSESGGIVILTGDTEPIDGLTVGGGMTLNTNGHRLIVLQEGLALLRVLGEGSAVSVAASPVPQEGVRLQTDILSVGEQALLSLTDAGAVVGVEAVIEPLGRVVGTGQLLLDNLKHGPGGLVLSNEGTLQAEGGELLIVAYNGGEIDLDGPSDEGSLTVKGDSSLVVEGVIRDPYSGYMTIQTSGRFEFPGELAFDSDGDLEISGGIAHNFAGRVVGEHLVMGGTIHARRTAIFECGVTFTPESKVDLEEIDNAPTTVHLFEDATIQNGATFEGSGIVRVDRGAVLSTEDSASIGVTLEVARGTLDPGTPIGNLRVHGFYNQFSESTCRIDIVGPEKCDMIDVRGRANLGGTLEVRFIDGYEPRVRDQFMIVRGLTGVDGRFDTVRLPALPDGMEMEVSYGGKTVSLFITERRGGLQRLGDCNQDGVLDVSDPLKLLFHLFAGDPMLPCEGDLLTSGNRTLLDSNGSGEVDLSDALHVLFFLFNGGPPPVGSESHCVEIEGCPQACAS